MNQSGPITLSFFWDMQHMLRRWCFLSLWEACRLEHGRPPDTEADLLVVYAVVEGVVGLFSIAFHKIFIASTDFVFLSVLSSIDWVWASDLLRWTLAALLVLPQSILLGTTFPLMSGGIIRSFPENPGKTLSVLYFTNTLGAAIGILASGFVLIESIGLPGTLFIAGVVNLSLAMVVWLLSHKDPRQTLPVEVVPETSPAESRAGGLFTGLLLCSALTGTASFMYEIGWIRMLNLVLGASTHAFELMLSAFILGLAIGGFLVRRRVDGFRNPILALGWIQLVMGIMAVATLPVYGYSFEFMSYIIKAISKTDPGYVLFNLASHGIALSVMLPATICAGMTLPIITYILFSGGYGEPAIGRVYSVNTLGGLIGIVVSVLFIMPAMGLKSLIITGAVIDILLGLSLLWYVLFARNRNLWWSSVAIAGGIVLVVVSFFHIDPNEAASGVFRSGKITKKDEVLYHRDGKTATIILARQGNTVTIRTNGKPDASISTTDIPTRDEVTMILLGAIPMAVHPDAKNVANIGMGSGLTSHIVLANPNIQRLDTIEIEAEMVKAAKGFGDRVKRAFTDPRSKINIEDAKAFFSGRQNSYDIIISVPSNPWVSGVSGLFSQEFYHLVKRHITSDGLFVQWMHLYEMDMGLVSSVIKALSGEFEDYSIYLGADSDMVILARKEGEIPAPSDSIFKFPGLKADLSRIGIKNRADLITHYVGSKKTLDGLFATYPTAPNSDYYPVLDHGAIKARFMNKNAMELLNVVTVPLPVVEVLEHNKFANAGRPEGVTNAFPLSLAYQQAITILNYFKQHNDAQQSFDQNETSSDVVLNLRLLRTIEHQCDRKGIEDGWLPGLHWLAEAVLPYANANELQPFWKYLESAECYSRVPSDVFNWIQLYRAVDERNYSGMISLSETLLSSGSKTLHSYEHYLVASALLGSLALGDSEHGISVFKNYMDTMSPYLLMKLLILHLNEMQEKGMRETKWKLN
jgi:predicted membrane-bound spermidine synthase